MGAHRNLDKVFPDYPGAKYSGKESEKFWKRLANVRRRNKVTAAMLYEVACALQDIEYRVLRALETAEKE